MIWATVSSWSSFCWLYRASLFSAAKNIMSDFGIDYLVMSMCKVISYVGGRECLLWPVCSIDKPLLPFVLHFVLRGQTSLFLQVSLDFLVLHSNPCDEKNIFLGVLVLKGLVSLHGTIQLQLLQRYWLGHRLRLLWYWMVCLGNGQRSFCRFWDCIQVLHFRLFCWPWWLLHFFWGILACSSRYNGHLS